MDFVSTLCEHGDDVMVTSPRLDTGYAHAFFCMVKAISKQKPGHFKRPRGMALSTTALLMCRGRRQCEKDLLGMSSALQASIVLKLPIKKEDDV